MKIKDKDSGGEVRSTSNRWLGVIKMAVGDGNGNRNEIREKGTSEKTDDVQPALFERRFDSSWEK